MGCDIHLYWEQYDEHADAYELYEHLKGERDYYVFALMAGVRDLFGRIPVVVAPRGIPDNIALGTLAEYTVPYCDYYAQHYQTSTIDLGSRRRLINPDWHTPSWLTKTEVVEVLARHKQAWDDAAPQRAKEHEELRAVFAEMDLNEVGKSTAQKFLDTPDLYKEVEGLSEFIKYAEDKDRIVFWFDN